MSRLPVTGRKTILIVDDEPAILSITASILVRQDYEVWTAHSGEDALEKYRGRESQIAVLLADVVMPGITGPDLAERLLRIHPTLHVLFMSGWDEAVIGRCGAFRRNIRTILKPFTPDGLIETLETVLQDPIEQNV